MSAKRVGDLCSACVEHVTLYGGGWAGHGCYCQWEEDSATHDE